MRPITVQEILSCTERLGITETFGCRDSGRTVAHLCRHPASRPDDPPSPLPDSLLIIATKADGQQEPGGWEERIPPSCRSHIRCLAFPARKRVTLSDRQYADRTQTPLFASRYDDSLLESRLLGLFRERGERQVVVHGVLVVVRGRGVLLTGESGVGKTACGLALMRGDNRWVADDAVVLQGRGDAVYGRGHSRTAAWIAPRSRGLLLAAELLGAGRILPECRVDLIIRLLRGTVEGRGVQQEPFQEMVGVSLPRLDLAADRDPRRVAKRVARQVRRLRDSQSGSGATAGHPWGNGIQHQRTRLAPTGAGGAMHLEGGSA